MKIMTKKKNIIVGLVIISISLWYAGKYYFHPNAQEADEVWVQVTEVKTSALPMEVKAIGTLTARSVEITPELAGHVEKIFFKDGTDVQQGTPLIQLDDAIYKAKYSSTKAKLAYSENNFKRMTLLGKRGAIAQQAIDMAEVELKERKAEAEESEVLLNKMKLLAPFDGVVDKSKVNLGDYVTTGQSVVTLTDVKHLHVEYNVPEKYLPQLKLGQEIKITTTTYPNKVFTGNLTFISPQISLENRSLLLYAEVDNHLQILAPGMFVSIEQLLGTQESSLMIPSRSLVPIIDGEQVYKVIEGKAFATTVKLGKRMEESVQVLEGLKAGDRIITDGQLKVRNGMGVKIKS